MGEFSSNWGQINEMRCMLDLCVICGAVSRIDRIGYRQVPGGSHHLTISRARIVAVEDLNLTGACGYIIRHHREVFTCAGTYAVRSNIRGHCIGGSTWSRKYCVKCSDAPTLGGSVPSQLGLFHFGGSVIVEYQGYRIRRPSSAGV